MLEIFVAAHRGIRPPRRFVAAERQRIPRWPHEYLGHVHVYREANVKIDVMAVTRGVPVEVHDKQTQMVHVTEVFVAASGDETSRMGRAN
jgi:hypothetical protein